MFANLRTRFAIQRSIAKCEKAAKFSGFSGSMAIIASKLEHEAKGNIVPLAMKPLEELCNKHTELVRKFAQAEEGIPVSFYKAQLDSVIVCAINENDLDMSEVKDQTIENVLKKLINIKLLPARFLSIDENLL